MPDLCQVLRRVKTEVRHQGGELDEKGWALLGRGPQLCMKHFGRKEETLHCTLPHPHTPEHPSVGISTSLATSEITGGGALSPLVALPRGRVASEPPGCILWNCPPVIQFIQQMFTKGLYVPGASFCSCRSAAICFTPTSPATRESRLSC